MITVEQALALCLAQVAPVGVEDVPLAAAAGRVLAQPVQAGRDQPPFHASAMDGYACRAADVESGASLTVVGEAAAGHGWDGTIKAGEALRIFTGAPLPGGADRVVIQEDVSRDGDRITLGDRLSPETFVRPSGADFAKGFQIDAPRRLTASDVALLAAMNIAKVTCATRPRIALIATGDELVMPGGAPRPDQIIASNIFALKALVEAAGAEALIVPIAADTQAGLETAFATARDWGADVIVSIGGASVGDHDLLADFVQRWGIPLAFHKIAMRPGKPLIAGKGYLGLPGNPVSAIVCGHLFLLPMVRQMLGLHDVAAPEITAMLGADVAANGPRAHYMRAKLSNQGAARVITPFDRQDSALLSVLTQADALLIRPVGDGPRTAGTLVKVIPL